MVMLHIFHCACTNVHISTSGVKSDVTIVFLHLDFLTNAKISAICVHLIWLLIFAWIFRTSWPKMAFLRGCKIGERLLRCWPNELVLTFEVFHVCANFCENRLRNATWECAKSDRQTESQTDRMIKIISSIWHSRWTLVRQSWPSRTVGYCNSLMRSPVLLAASR